MNNEQANRHDQKTKKRKKKEKKKREKRKRNQIKSSQWRKSKEIQGKQREIGFNHEVLFPAGCIYPTGFFFQLVLTRPRIYVGGMNIGL